VFVRTECLVKGVERRTLSGACVTGASMLITVFQRVATVRTAAFDRFRCQAARHREERSVEAIDPAATKPACRWLHRLPSTGDGLRPGALRENRNGPLVETLVARTARSAWRPPRGAL